MIKEFLIVGLGGAMGSMLRYAASAVSLSLALDLTIATLFVNGAGSLILGIIIAICNKGSWYLLLAVGFCGGFTTFSTFSAQTVELLQTGKFGMGLIYIFTTVVFCLVSTWAGMVVGKIFIS